MPDAPFEKVRPHPAKSARPSAGGVFNPALQGYAELTGLTNFSFLEGASHPEEMVERAAELGYRAAAVADINTLAGAVRAHAAARRVGIPLAVGARLVLSEPTGLAVTAYATDAASYARLSRLLTLGKRRALKGSCWLTLDDLEAHAAGLLGVVMPPDKPDELFRDQLDRLAAIFDPGAASLAASVLYRGDDAARARRLASLAETARVPLVAAGDTRYHDPSRRALQDVVTCVRLGTTVERAGWRLAANAERHLRPAAEMARLFARYPRAVDRAAELALRASAFGLDQLRYRYPAASCPPGTDEDAHLRAMTERGAMRRYPGGVPPRVRAAIEHELALVAELGYAAYFLTCEEIVAFARSRGILCQGRGGAANSAVCYCLGLTEVDPADFSLLFERFVSRERREPPDIDIDFEHQRREEVIQHIYDIYGRDRAALTAEVIAYRGRSAVREVGKAMGLSLDRVDALAKQLDRWGDTPRAGRVREAGLDPDDPLVSRVVELSAELQGFPRHLSQHVGGFVIARDDLRDLVPIENAAMEDRTVIEWDKDDIDALGILKIDCLGLGMLSCVRGALELVDTAAGEAGTPPGRPAPEPADGSAPGVLSTYRDIARGPADPAVYDMISDADTIGVFQIESRAQMTMLPRLRPRCFYDLVIEVALVRPGPIQGGMVHPYLRRREGLEPVTFPGPEVEQVLGRTLGVPLFQEQAMQLAIVAAGFTPDEADGLRRSMAAWKRKGNAIYRYGQRLVDGMLARGYPRDFAERCFEQIKGFSEYGFPESHAASFALIVYVSAWLKRYHPAAFAAALINAQPMGFYAPAQIVRDAEDHGVEVRPIDVNRSARDCTLEPAASSAGNAAAREPRAWGRGGPALRLGFRLVRGLREHDAERLEHAVARLGPFDTIEALWRASRVPVAALRALARADAFGSMGLDRQRALWQVRALKDTPMPLFDALDATDETALDDLPAVPPARLVLQDYHATGMSLKAHPVAFLRKALEHRGVIEAAELRSPDRCPSGRRIAVAGIVLCRQRPGTASGVVFITLEDETAVANLVIWKDVFERFRNIARLSTAMIARGKVERQGQVVHLHADTLEPIDRMLPAMRSISRDFQ